MPISMTTFYDYRSLMNRQYNLEVYEHKRGHYTDRCSLCGLGTIGCTCGHSFHSIFTNGCLLSHASCPHGYRLAVADHILRTGCFCSCNRCCGSARCRADVRAGTRTNGHACSDFTSHRGSPNPACGHKHASPHTDFRSDSDIH